MIANKNTHTNTPNIMPYFFKLTFSFNNHLDANIVMTTELVSITPITETSPSSIAKRLKIEDVTSHKDCATKYFFASIFLKSALPQLP